MDPPLTLARLRESKGLLQKELAVLARVRPATLSAIERGQTAPRAATVAVLAGAMGVAPETVRAACQGSRRASQTGAVAEPGAEYGWAFAAGLDRDLRAGLHAELVAMWTHTSTGLEGNTISAGDTHLILSEGLTVSGHSLREHQEIRGHADGVGLIRSWLDRRRPIVASDLHALHRFVQAAHVTDVSAPVGSWKVEPNGTQAVLSDGSVRWHDYASAWDVPVLMERWLEALNRELRAAASADREEQVAAFTRLHLGFTGIHPYADGNGRLARLLANLPLLRWGSPPLIVPVEQRRVYLTLLGDYSIERGAALVGEPLVTDATSVADLRRFFASCWGDTWALIERYTERQARR